MKVYLYATIAVIVIAAVGYYTYRQRELGRELEKAQQEKSNAEFRKKTIEGFTDFDTCDRAGGLYNFSKGTCEFE